MSMASLWFKRPWRRKPRWPKSPPHAKPGLWNPSRVLYDRCPAFRKNQKNGGQAASRPSRKSCPRPLQSSRSFWRPTSTSRPWAAQTGRANLNGAGPPAVCASNGLRRHRLSALCPLRFPLRPPPSTPQANKNQEQKTKNKEQGTKNKEPRTRNQEQGTKNKAPRTKQQRTKNQEPRTRNKPPPFPKKTPPSLCASRSATPALRPPPPSRAPNRSVS